MMQSNKYVARIGTEPKRTGSGTRTFKTLRTGTGTGTFILINKSTGTEL